MGEACVSCGADREQVVLQDHDGEKYCSLRPCPCSPVRDAAMQRDIDHCVNRKTPEGVRLELGFLMMEGEIWQ